MKKIVCIISIASFLIGTTPGTLSSAERSASIKLRNMHSYEVTEKQLESLKAQKGITFYHAMPDALSEGQIAVAVPEELGGGYLVGTAEDIAAAFNSAGITVGLTASSVSGTAVLVGGILIVTLVGIIVAALNATSTHKH